MDALCTSRQLKYEKLIFNFPKLSFSKYEIVNLPKGPQFIYISLQIINSAIHINSNHPDVHLQRSKLQWYLLHKKDLSSVLID